MAKTSLILKLAKMIAKFADVATDKGTLIINGEIEVGAEAFILAEDGEYIPAEDGEYAIEGERVLVIKDGKIDEIREAEKAEEEAVEEVAETVEEVAEEAFEEDTTEEVAEEKVEEEATEDEKDIKIAELEAKVAELTSAIAEKDARIIELENALAEAAKPVEAPIMMSKTPKSEEAKSNPALKYFKN